jgi:catalase
VADGVDGAAVASAQAVLLKAGAVPRLVGPRIGPFKSGGGKEVDADASLENEPGVVFDAVIVPGGAAAMLALRRDGRAIEFLKEQFRHGKAMLVIAAGTDLLVDAGIPAEPGTPGLLLAKELSGAVLQQFVKDVAAHRHPARETDPPLV